MSKKVKAPAHCSAEYKRTLYHFHSVTKHGWGGTLKEAGALDSFMFEWAPDSLLDFGCGFTGKPVKPNSRHRRYCCKSQ